MISLLAHASKKFTVLCVYVYLRERPMGGRGGLGEWGGREGGTEVEGK